MNFFLYLFPLFFGLTSSTEIKNEVCEDQNLYVDFRYSQDFSNCNTDTNPCATVYFNVYGGGIDVWWDFGSFDCYEIADGRNAIVAFDVQEIYNTTGQHGYQYIPVTVFTEDYYGNMGSKTKTVRVVVC